MKVKIKVKEIRELLGASPPEFEKYVSPILNMANYYAQGTRARVVGQMSELIQEFSGETLEEWARWYQEQHPEAIANATEKIAKKVEQLKEAMVKIDRDTIERWTKDLVIAKTLVGLKFQEAILKKGAEFKKTSYRISEPEEEAKGIDGYIGDEAVSIKAETYKSKDALPESIDIKIIYYKKDKVGITVDYASMK